MSFNLLNIEEIPAGIVPKDFRTQYINQQKPVVIKQFSKQWPAYEKWSLDYMKEIAGHKDVPLYDNRPVSHEFKFNEPHKIMSMSDYIDLLKSEPTKYRIFLWNIIKEVPTLQDDFSMPDFDIRLMKGLPMLFFGGQDSYTFMHYDIDLANIFHFHFHGKKMVILFDQNQNKYLYKVPHALISHQDIDYENPDFNKWPALKHARGYKCYLEHGDMLYMPEGYWHYMKYITPGFSMSLRAVARNPKNFTQAVYNVFVMRHFDNLMRRLRGQEWIDWKNNQAIKNSEKYA